jgi:hypothetical protein
MNFDNVWVYKTGEQAALTDQNRVKEFQPFKSRRMVAFWSGPLCSINWCPNHGSPVPLLEYQTTPRLKTPNILWVQEKGP